MYSQLYSSIMEKLAIFTNESGRKRHAADWKDLEFLDFLKFHVVILHMGHVVRGKMQDYWTERDEVVMQVIRSRLD